MYIISYTLLFLTSLDRSYRKLRKPNEVFDRMVETMSVVSSYSKREKDSDDSSYRRRMQKRKSRRSSSLLQVPSPESSSGAGGLSFVKSASSFNERSTSSKASEVHLRPTLRFIFASSYQTRHLMKRFFHHG